MHLYSTLTNTVNQRRVSKSLPRAALTDAPMAHTGFTQCFVQLSLFFFYWETNEAGPT